MDNFISSFPVWIPFLSFFCLTTVARTASTSLNRSDRSGHPCLIPELSGKALRFTTEHFCLWVCHKWLLLCWYMFSLYTLMVKRVFIMNFIKYFFCIFWDNHVVFVAIVYTFICIYWTKLAIWDESNLIMVYNPFYVLLDSVCNILLKIFAFFSIKDIGLSFSFFHRVFVYF